MNRNEVYQHDYEAKIQIDYIDELKVYGHNQRHAMVINGDTKQDS